MPSATKKTMTASKACDETTPVESPNATFYRGGRGGGDQVRPFRRKRRAWLFKVERITNHGITEADLLTSVCKRYRTVKTLIVKPDGVAPASARAPQGNSKAAPASDSSFVEITFAGPQPSENCGALLCLLLGGNSVQAWPVELPRGRKRKNAVSSTCSDKTAEDEDSASATKNEDVADIGPPRGGSSGVPPTLSPSPMLQEPKREAFDAEDTDTQLPRYPHVTRQHLHLDQRKHQHQHQHQQFGGQDALFGLSPSFSAVQTPLEAGPVESENAEGGSGSGSGSRSFGVGVGGPYLLAPEGCGSSDSVSVDGGGGKGMLPMEEVRVTPSRKECDLEGRPFPRARMTGDGAPGGPADNRQCYLVFTGLEETGHDLNSLRVTALFGVDAVHQTATVTSPLQVGDGGRAYSSVFYPSLQEIWPELYNMPNVQSVEVDIEVEILTDSSGEYRYHGPQLKVVYHRAGLRANVATAAAAAGEVEAARGYWGRTAAASNAEEFRPMYSHLCVNQHR